MILYPEMIYYNIHTHQSAVDPNEKAVISIDLRNHSLLKPDLYYSAGIHPWYADTDKLNALQTIAKQPHVIAIGEAGLDKCTSTPWEVQKEIFLNQIELAENVQKPLIVHCVKAWTELITISKIIKPTVPWIIHGFRGKRKLANQLLQAGFYLSFGIYHQPEAVHEAWSTHRLFVETDENKVGIQTVYDSISTSLAISQTTLSQEILANLQTWPHTPF